MTLKLDDLDWLPQDYRDQDNYPLCQFHISKAKGRVIGFFDDKRVFNVVLLDPNHNAQPSKDWEYRVRSCSPVNDDYEDLCGHLGRLQTEAPCKEPDGCQLHFEFRRLRVSHATRDVFTIELQEASVAALNRVLSEGKGKSIADVIELGILAVDEKQVEE